MEEIFFQEKKTVKKDSLGMFNGNQSELEFQLLVNQCHPHALWEYLPVSYRWCSYLFNKKAWTVFGTQWGRHQQCFKANTEERELLQPIFERATTACGSLYMVTLCDAPVSLLMAALGRGAGGEALHRSGIFQKIIFPWFETAEIQPVHAAAPPFQQRSLANWALCH